jgi:hypothetical protein
MHDQQQPPPNLSAGMDAAAAQEQRIQALLADPIGSTFAHHHQEGHSQSSDVRLQSMMATQDEINERRDRIRSMMGGAGANGGVASAASGGQSTGSGGGAMTQEERIRAMLASQGGRNVGGLPEDNLDLLMVQENRIRAMLLEEQRYAHQSMYQPHLLSQLHQPYGRIHSFGGLSSYGLPSLGGLQQFGAPQLRATISEPLSTGRYGQGVATRLEEQVENDTKATQRAAEAASVAQSDEDKQAKESGNKTDISQHPPLKTEKSDAADSVDSADSELSRKITPEDAGL